MLWFRRSGWPTWSVSNSWRRETYSVFIWGCVRYEHLFKGQTVSISLFFNCGGSKQNIDYIIFQSEIHSWWLWCRSWISGGSLHLSQQSVVESSQRPSVWGRKLMHSKSKSLYFPFLSFILFSLFMWWMMAWLVRSLVSSVHLATLWLS